MFRIIGETNIDFIGKRRFAFVLSLALVALGLFAFIMIVAGKANMGIDFAGGVMIQGHFQESVAIDELRSALTTPYPDIQVTALSKFEKPNAYIIKTKNPETEAAGEERREGIMQTLTEAFPGNAFERDYTEVIGPAVGETLRDKARWAILISLIGILIYIGFRFDFRSGVAATIATFHDVLAVTGVFYLLNVEFDLLIITALLTLAGYSLTDTVVVYDRIRENLRKFRSKGEFVGTVNRSINEVLSRTFNTSITVLFVVVTLFFFGGEVLADFSLALILGVIIGTYSSVFVASPIVVEWEARRPRRFK
ncbi:MAG TPA: protein translocase subunit SecF [Acidobacteriota bacterium]|nr:protein translocase subunit SecF [Acidobacteriota bacterium]